MMETGTTKIHRGVWLFYSALFLLSLHKLAINSALSNKEGHDEQKSGNIKKK